MRTVLKLVASAMLVGIVPIGATPLFSPTEQTGEVAGIDVASGKLTLLRIHDVGTRYGPPSDEIDVEVIIRLDSVPTKAFGFQLRDDGNRPVREGMLHLLRDAFNNDWTVTLDYYAEPGRNNSILFRVWVTK